MSYLFEFFRLALVVLITGLCCRIVLADPCIVTIYTNPFIKRVVVPHPVACFKGANNLEEKLGNFAKEIGSETDAYDVVEKCAELAHGKHFKMFALANGVCLSGADTQNRYYISGTNGAKCKDGIGQDQDSMFVYSLDHLLNLKPLGCYSDESNDRALPDHYANFRDQIDWKQLDKTIHQCAQVAYNKGYHYFAVQYYGECHAGNNASATYAKHGESEEGCYWSDKTLGFGVGKENANFVYKIN